MAKGRVDIKASFSAIVDGRVQGVFFRSFVQQNARKLGVTGYVRNLSDGTVEVVAEGEKSALESLLEHVREGPLSAKVNSVDVKWQEYAGKYPGFTVSG